MKQIPALAAGMPVVLRSRAEHFSIAMAPTAVAANGNSRQLFPRADLAKDGHDAVVQNVLVPVHLPHEVS